MKVQFWQIDRVTPYDQNPRRNDEAVAAVAASIEEFGFRQPIVVDEAGMIIVGHTRWKAARKLQLAKVPVHLATDLTPEQIRAYRIADNQTATIADWDLDILAIEPARGCRPAPRRRHHPAGQYGSAVQRQGRTPLEQRDRRGQQLVRLDQQAPPEVRPRAASREGQGDAQKDAGQGPATGE